MGLVADIRIPQSTLRSSFQRCAQENPPNFNGIFTRHNWRI